MKKLLLLLMFLPAFANGQIVDTISYYGTDLDSTTFTFSNEDSLTHFIVSVGLMNPFAYDTTSVTIDTSTATLWQIGNTLKPVFSNGTTSSHGIMTDTANPYPPNANAYFVLEVGYVSNFIVDFWHRFQMDSLHAGGIVEFSTDSGATWMNIAYCNQIDTQNVYTQADTVISGQPAFTGESHGEQLSRIQFLNCEAGERTTATSCIAKFSFDYPSTINIRFRFVSDSTIDSLSGWMIDSIRIENPGCFYVPGHVHSIANQNTISIFPNPAYDEISITSLAQEITRVEITDMLGRQVYLQTAPANCLLTQVDVAGLPCGVYFVKVNNTDPSQAGTTLKFVKE